MAASEDLEVAGLELEHYRAGDARFLARCGPVVLCKSADHRLNLGQ